MAVHKPDHNLPAANQLPDKDDKLLQDDPVAATTLFPTHTKMNLSPCKRQTLQFRNF